MSHEMDDGSNCPSNASGSIFVRSRTMLADICQRMRPHLKFVARQQTQRLPNCKDDESDIVQVAMYKAYERFDQFGGSTTGQWRAWLVQIVRNHAKDVQRFWSQDCRAHANEEHGSQVMRFLADRTIETPSKILADEERQQLVDAALESLSAAQQQLFRWRIFQQATYREIAERLRVTEPTARRRSEAAIEAFKVALGKLDDSILAN